MKLYEEEDSHHRSHKNFVLKGCESLFTGGPSVSKAESVPPKNRKY